MPRPKVIIRHCAEYDPFRIQRIIQEGLDELELTPHGRTLVKPNVVASGKHFPHAFTRSEFMEGVLRALKSRAASNVQEIAVGERCGITVPTRFAYSQAGYYEMADRVGNIEMYHFEEVPQAEIPLYHKGRLRDALFTPEPVAKADFFVNCPKFKAHPWTTVTFSMKSFIGIQDDRHRLIDHDHTLDRKVADLQYITQAQFIAIDAIIAGEGRMLTPIPKRLNLILMGNNQLAFDAVCCHIIGVDPMEVPHLRMAHERGFGPVALEDIDVSGDVSFEEAQERAQGFQTGLIRVEDYFEGSNIQAYAGPPPSTETDYCWGGCPGAIEEAIEILRQFDPGTDAKMPPLHVVFGKYEGKINAQPGEKVVFIGDCTTFHGDIAGKPVDIRSVYRDHAGLDPRHDAKDTDIFAKMGQVTWEMFKKRKDDVIVIRGCPVSVAEQVLALVKLGKLKNPYFDPSQSIPFTNTYFSKRTRQAVKRIFGEKYHIEGGVKRGDARPPQNLPPEGVTPSPLEV